METKMHKLLTFLKTQNPCREGQGHAGGWLEARVWTRCQPKDPRNSNAVPSFVQARFLSILRALCTTLALGAVVFGVCSNAFAQLSPILGFPPGVFQNRAAIDGGSAPSSFATWNTTDSAAGITRSNGNLTLTYSSGSGFQGVRATNSHSTGKFYFEVTTTINANNTVIGLANANYVTTNPLWANSLDSVGRLQRSHRNKRYRSGYCANLHR